MSYEYICSMLPYLLYYYESQTTFFLVLNSKLLIVVALRWSTVLFFSSTIIYLFIHVVLYTYIVNIILCSMYVFIISYSC